MRKVELLDRLANCVPILERSGVKNTQKVFDAVQLLDGPGISKHVKWLRQVEKACIREGEVYKDLKPEAWVNLCMIDPASEHVRTLRRLKREVKDAWRARPRNETDATK